MPPRSLQMHARECARHTWRRWRSSVSRALSEAAALRGALERLVPLEKRREPLPRPNAAQDDAKVEELENVLRLLLPESGEQLPLRVGWHHRMTEPQEAGGPCPSARTDSVEPSAWPGRRP